MITIKVYFRKSKEMTGEGFLWVSFYVNREKVNFSTRVKCFEKEFDQKHFRIKGNAPNASDKNLIIDNILARINDVLVKYRLRNKKITRTGFLKTYNRPDDYETFFDFVNVTNFFNCRCSLKGLSVMVKPKFSKIISKIRYVFKKGETP